MSNKKILKLNELLILNVDALTKRVSNRESERREFKLKFDNGNLPKLARTMASFANREGGVLSSKSFCPIAARKSQVAKTSLGRLLRE